MWSHANEISRAKLMCGRYNNHLPKMHGWAQALQEWPEEVVSSFNVAPTMSVAAFRQTTGEAMRWGLIPAWSKEFDSKYATFNARVETISDKSTFRSAWKKKQRCLIPMAGYYEWKGLKGAKQPFYISGKDNGLVVAGLYEAWGESELLSCTIITRPADEDLGHIHGRMPVILDPKNGKSWLDGNLSSPAEFLINITKPPLISYPVSNAVGNTRNNNPDLINQV